MAVGCVARVSTMSSVRSIFLLGATGYVGGSLLVTLLREYPSATISTLVRNSRSSGAIKSLSPDRINIVLGSHSDTSIIESEVEKADLTINAANCDDLDLTKSIINGFKKKSKGYLNSYNVGYLRIDHLKTGILWVYSGSAVVLAEEATGPFLGKLDERGQKIWDDTKTEDLRAISPSALHRSVDLAVLGAHDSGILDAYIICPGLIYGPGIGPVKSTSIQVPLLLQVALRRRQAYFAGEGTNIWCNIHIQDLLRIYTHVIKHAFTSAGSTARVDSYDNYYFAAGSEDATKDVAEAIATALYEKELVDSPHAQSLSPEDPDGKLLAMYLGHTSRAISVRAKSLGWSPKEKKLTESEVMSIEVDNFLKTTEATSH
ncbi:NAD-P-binding protein [Rhizoctonia solani]|uniref:NAD-P-binding protein n=1 Tax=Rhizoctonia solani TaxID=456999 RepID=A0A8H7ICX9_9AGAM|nr:NAD-P-binding protein [Rhizoctonia solani]